MILLLRTDKPEAELYLYENNSRIDEIIWQAHRELSDTLLIKIAELLKRNNKALKDIHGIGIYQGPGSFTGLRIGISVANALAYSLNIPIVGVEGEGWLKESIKAISKQKAPQVIMPEYGSEAHITKPRK